MLTGDVQCTAKISHADINFQVIQSFKITHLQVAPPIIVMLARRPETKKYDLSSLKYVMSGAAPLSKELQNEVSRRFKLSITQGWGKFRLIPHARNMCFGYVGQHPRTLEFFSTTFSGIFREKLHQLTLIAGQA